MQSKAIRESDENRAVENAARDLGLKHEREVSQFVNSIWVPCGVCGRVSSVQCEEPIINVLSRPGLGTAFVVTCCNCLTELLICYRAGAMLHVEQMNGPWDLPAAFDRAWEKVKRLAIQQPLTTLTQPPQSATETTLSWYRKGDKNLQAQRYGEAIACFDRALAICPKAARVWRNKGMALSRSGNRATAIECYARALDLNPRDSITWFNRGTTVQRMGRHEEALACFDRSTEINATDPDVWCNKGMALHSLGRIKEEISCFDKALALNQEHVNAWLNKGIALAETGELHVAIQCFEKVLAINPIDADAWAYKANSYVQLGNRDLATEAFKRFIEVAGPDGPRGWPRSKRGCGSTAPAQLVMKEVTQRSRITSLRLMGASFTMKVGTSSARDVTRHSCSTQLPWCCWRRT